MAEVVTFGKDEQSEGILFLRLFNPTDLDNASESIRVYLKGKLGFIDEYTYLGLWGGKVTDFLKRYIEASHVLKQNYDDYNYEPIYNYLIEKYNYNSKELDTYFEALKTTYAQGKIQDTIRYPNRYTPDNSTVFSDSLKSTANYVIGAVALYGIGYLILREYIFGGKRKSAKKIR